MSRGGFSNDTHLNVCIFYLFSFEYPLDIKYNCYSLLGTFERERSTKILSFGFFAIKIKKEKQTYEKS